jgi:tRNA(Leu) C34 or U34 (ribose-2'-O)-methylase TrmL
MAGKKPSKSKKKTNAKPSVVKVAGLWELGWNTPIKEIELWEYPLRDFKVDDFYMSPVTGIDSNFVKERKYFEEILEENKDLSFVYVDEASETSLAEFAHPNKALYIFGKASFSPMAMYKKSKDLSVRIDTAENKGLLWPHQAAAIVLYDRMVKSWQ